TTAISLPRPPRWGWALVSVGPPCVAQRVCAIETWPVVSVAPSSASRRLASLPARLVTRPEPSSLTVTPAESYPRYSRRARPWRAASTGREEGAWARGPAYPTIPHMGLTLTIGRAHRSSPAGSARGLPHLRAARRAALAGAERERSEMRTGAVRPRSRRCARRR